MIALSKGMSPCIATFVVFAAHGTPSKSHISVVWLPLKNSMKCVSYLFSGCEASLCPLAVHLYRILCRALVGVNPVLAWLEAGSIAVVDVHAGHGWVAL